MKLYPSLGHGAIGAGPVDGYVDGTPSAGGAGQLVASITRTATASSYSVNFDTKGGADYLVADGEFPSYKRKNITTSLFGTPIRTWSFTGATSNPPGYSASGSDGKPSPSSFSVTTMYGGFVDAGQYWEVTVPAGTKLRRLEGLFEGPFGHNFEITATLSDGSATPVTINKNVQGSGTGDYAFYALDYYAGSENQTLTLRVTSLGNANQLQIGWLWLSGETSTVTVSDNTDATIGGTEDNELDQFSANTNHGSATLSYVDAWVSPDFIVTMALRFPLVGEVGSIASDSKLRLYLAEKGGAKTALQVFEILRPDWSESQSTFNQYKTGSNWTSGGAQGVGTDRGSTILATADIAAIATGNYVEFSGAGLDGLIQNAIANSQTSVNLLVQFADLSFTAASFARFVTSEGTDGQRPQLVYNLTNNGAPPAPMIIQYPQFLLMMMED